MYYIEWGPQFFTHIEEIDIYHEKLFGIINAFGKKEETAKFYDVIHFLNELNSYAKSHFSIEEEYMEKMDYPYYENHKTIHGNLVKSVAQVKAKVESDISNENYFKEVFEFASDWLVTHILEEDKSFINFCEEYNAVSDERYVNSVCEIYDTDNVIMGMGTITEITEDKLMLLTKGSIDGAKEHGIIKLHISGRKLPFQTWSGRINKLIGNHIEVINVKHVAHENKRHFCRISTQIKGEVVLPNGESAYADVLDISLGGLLFETDATLHKNDVAILKLQLNKEIHELKCRVIRTSMKHYPKSQCACAFEGLKHSDENAVIKFIFEKQKELRNSSKII